MSNRESFITRWARRKRATLGDAEAQPRAYRSPPPQGPPQGGGLSHVTETVDRSNIVLRDSCAGSRVSFHSGQEAVVPLARDTGTLVSRTSDPGLDRGSDDPGPRGDIRRSDRRHGSHATALPEGREAAERAELSADKAPRTAEVTVDLAKLPPIESIAEHSDIRAFLASGVPPELTRAALRRAWSADPSIRDFVGLSENAWDFNAPDAIAGFGPLEMTDEIRQQIAQFVGRSMGPRMAEAPPWSEVEKQERTPPLEIAPESDAMHDLAQHPIANPGPLEITPSELASSAEERGTQKKLEEGNQDIAKRTHGGALPR